MAEKPVGRPMKFPYTFSAQYAQFPWKFYLKNQWLMRYYFIGIIVCIPIFKAIGNFVNTPANVAKWDEIRRKEMEGHHD